LPSGVIGEDKIFATIREAVAAIEPVSVAMR
jgi:hypothetical protein